jgi:hypothetical protein
MAKQVFILLVIFTGFFLVPKLSYSCVSKPVVKTSCSQQGKNCAKDKTCCGDHHSKKDSNDNCGGNCPHNSCHCPASNLTIVLPHKQGIDYGDYGAEKQTYYSPGFVLSQGFHSIWLPPKIG